MEWLIWRQHRGQALWAAGDARGDMRAHAGGPGCSPPRASPLPALLGPESFCGACGRRVTAAGFRTVRQHYSYTIPSFELGVPLVLAVMDLLGAPWSPVRSSSGPSSWPGTQSVTPPVVRVEGARHRRRAHPAFGLLAGLANYRLSQPLPTVSVTSSRWPWFFSAGLAPRVKSYWRSPSPSPSAPGAQRTLPAVGAALAGFLVLLLATGTR